MPLSLEKEAKETLLVDSGCPLLRDFYTPDEARREIEENASWRAIYGQETLHAALLLAESRSQGKILSGRQASLWLGKNYPLSNLQRESRLAAELYFQDPGGVEREGRIYDPQAGRFLRTDRIRRGLLEGLRPLRRDIVAYLYPGEGYPLLSFDSRAGQKILVPFGTPVLFLGPFRRGGEEMLLHPQARAEGGRLVHSFAFRGRLQVEVQKEEDGITFLALS